ncbi:PHD-type domain-containing protein [Favolaschia claudopus]|uniref:PHD-type domain-containing protein n=1 Tax=Favolaschia claudopus TaxID=2862362 RepID=A0AAW0BC39_9AGAR
MSTRATRKRRRSQAFPEEIEDAADPTTRDDDSEIPKFVPSTGQDRLDKEREVWDAFKDEHVEVFDLSPSLWRRFDLVREHEQRDAENTAALLRALTKYVQFRRACAQPPAISAPDVQPAMSEDVVPESRGLNPPTIESEDVTLQIATSSEKDQHAAARNSQPMVDDSQPMVEDPPPVLPNTPDTAGVPPSATNAVPPSPQAEPLDGRALLTTIVRLAEASQRDREEKFDLARNIVKSVERSIRLIDQAIAKQELALSHNTGSGTRLASVFPELTGPKKRLGRDTISPDLDAALGDDSAMTSSAAPQPRGRKKGKKGRKKESLPAEDLVLPPRPKPPIIPNADPNESRYCYCDQVSFGEMIACDDPRCEREWFHLTCTNLGSAPEGRKKWFCDDCVLRKKKQKR